MSITGTQVYLWLFSLKVQVLAAKLEIRYKWKTANFTILQTEFNCNESELRTFVKKIAQNLK